MKFSWQKREIRITLDGDLANVLRYPPAQTPGVLRFRLHPPTEEAFDVALRWAVDRLALTAVTGKLVVMDEKRIRIRG